MLGSSEQELLTGDRDSPGVGVALPSVVTAVKSIH